MTVTTLVVIPDCKLAFDFTQALSFVEWEIWDPESWAACVISGFPIQACLPAGRSGMTISNF
ncbi:MAG: hypothetical protein WC536_02015 [Patescibacteria group bacterium]